MMAKLQQMNEMSKQSSHFLLQDGYVTYKGKRYNDCTDTEKEVFNIVIGDVKPESGSDHEGWWHLKSTCGCYTMRLSGCYDRGVLNAVAEVYKSVGNHPVYYDLTNDQWLNVQEALEAEYERLVEDSEECERNHYYEELSHDWHQFI